MRASSFLPFAVAAFAFAFGSRENEASACGGCFHDQESPTVVTDHRMILSISKDQSTLYDQIRYSGEPSSFAWVLPIAGSAQIGISADAMFAGLDLNTQVTVVPAPPPVCPNNSKQRTTVGDNSSGGGESVRVIERAVVGPYETVQLASSDPNALGDWLANNGYTIPEDVKPIIAAYVAEKFNFLALKLVPGKGVQDMRPVRVTTVGAGAVLPLRMVAAGTGATVGITLWTVAEGRYEPQGFPSFVIRNDDLTWDYAAQKSDYVALRAAKTAEGSGRAWEIESSVPVKPSDYLTADFSQVTDDRWLPVKDENGVVVKTAGEVAKEDFEILFHGMPATEARITRMRADLAHAALAQDMILTASADQSLIVPTRTPAHSLNAPVCPSPSGNGDGAPSAAAPAASASGSSCAVGGGDATGWATFAFAMGVFAVTRRRRR